VACRVIPLVRAQVDIDSHTRHVWCNDRCYAGRIPLSSARQDACGSDLASSCSGCNYYRLVCSRCRRSHGKAPLAQRGGNRRSRFRSFTAFCFFKRLAITVVLFVFLYMFFGYFIAWRNPALRDFYGGVDTPDFFMALNAWQTTPRIWVLQIFRASLYFGCVLPLVGMLRAPKWETVLAISAFLSVWSLLLLLPNPVMPRTVAQSHFWVTLSCFLVFAAVLRWMLSDRRKPDSLAKAALSGRQIC
jgi:hypothetical protein